MLLSKDNFKRLLSLPIILKRIEKPVLFMTLLIRDEADVLEENLIFHKYMGVDGFIVTNNKSVDRTPEILQKYKELGWIKLVIEDDNRSYEQIRLVDNMIRIAKEKYNADWVINADADEFWYTQCHDLKSVLANSRFNILKCRMTNMLPVESGEFWETTCRVKSPIDYPLSDLSPYSMYRTQIPKVMHRTHGYQMIHAGNHSVSMVFPKRSTTDDILIYHYPTRSYGHFLRKIINGGAAIVHDPNLNNGTHWRYFYEIYRNGELENEYLKTLGRKYQAEFLKQDIIIHDSTIADLMLHLKNNIK